MKIMHLRIKTLMALGAGFLLGSRSGSGPWEFVRTQATQARSKLAEAQGGRAPDPESATSLSGDGRLPITSV
jgi:hypothetical protein